MKPYPKTTGLLVSMACRIDHAFGMPAMVWNGLRTGLSREEKIALLDQMSGAYERLTNNQSIVIPSDKQVLEEIYGHGFYSPHKESFYLNMHKEGLEVIPPHVET